VPFPDQRQRVVVTGPGAVAQPVRRIAVHQHLAGGEAQPERFRLLEQDIGRMRVHGAVDAARRDAVAQVLLQEGARNAARIGAIGELQLGRKGVALEPVEELGAVTRDHRRLWEMHVGVDEARGDQRILAEVPDLRAGRQQRADARRRSEMGDAPILHGHDRIGLVDEGPLEPDLERIAGEREGGAA
jgi:hypothetical protein